MNKTKDAIRDFIGKTGHNDTTVHESVEPAVKRETVKPTEHQDINTAINKEVHQDHYHRTVQPIQDRQTLPEKHEHRVGGVQHRDYDHRDHETTKKTLAAENQKYKDERVIKDTTHTQSHAPTVQGEHVHHHVHETVQPVLHKETIQPNVVHTTVPIHETHHNAAQHHSTTSLPPVSMQEYEQQGGALGGRKERFDAFEGEPKTIRGTLSTMHDKQDSGLKNPPEGVFHGDYDPLDGGRHHVSGGPQVGKSATTVGTHPAVSAQSSAQKEYRDAGKGTTSAHTERDTSLVESGKKDHPSLLNKLNPMTDSNGDGKAGFMK
ncbi:uncharacterized protein F4822DRAFT_432902 [Hypoxylon trugodes]|uniref:uncharacterized protein n=1 Tax=Hypoxylon trugodes TaxID=326681 RepID=UPI00219D411F|nr:uncharacterized protein F4822DRAFT_432902 [Hypoxylon trugodes]KAI1384356.1 hypothetical protein F4822DRAFT_432902 [Hypoxylon trugodes]